MHEQPWSPGLTRARARSQVDAVQRREGVPGLQVRAERGAGARPPSTLVRARTRGRHERPARHRASREARGDAAAASGRSDLRARARAVSPEQQACPGLTCRSPTLLLLWPASLGVPRRETDRVATPTLSPQVVPLYGRGCGGQDPRKLPVEEEVIPARPSARRLSNVRAPTPRWRLTPRVPLCRHAPPSLHPSADDSPVAATLLCATEVGAPSCAQSGSRHGNGALGGQLPILGLQVQSTGGARARAAPPNACVRCPWSGKQTADRLGPRPVRVFASAGHVRQPALRGAAQPRAAAAGASDRPYSPGSASFATLCTAAAAAGLSVAAAADAGLLRHYVPFVILARLAARRDPSSACGRCAGGGGFRLRASAIRRQQKSGVLGFRVCDGRVEGR